MVTRRQFVITGGLATLGTSLKQQQTLSPNTGTSNGPLFV